MSELVVPKEGDVLRISYCNLELALNLCSVVPCWIFSDIRKKGRGLLLVHVR
jgi:hypothetical protein